jgi:ribosomal protein S27E
VIDEFLGYQEADVGATGAKDDVLDSIRYAVMVCAARRTSISTRPRNTSSDVWRVRTTVSGMVSLLEASAMLCQECHEQRDRAVRMAETRVYSHQLAAEVSAWECPECGHTVLRDAGGRRGVGDAGVR